MADGVIAHEDVLQHIYAFLRAYGYKNALLALQNESRVPHNTIDVVQPQEADAQHGVTMSSPASLQQAVLEGQWDTVLTTYVDGLLLPEEVMFDLYENIFEELLTLRGFVHAARAFFTNSPVFAAMKRASAARYARLQQQLESQKNAVADGAVGSDSGPVPPHVRQKREALLRVLQEAITWNTEPYNGVLPAALWRLLNTDGGSNAELPSLKRRRMDTSDSAVVAAAPSATFLHYPLQCPKHIREKVVFANAEMPTSCAVATLSAGEDKQHNYTAIIVGKTDGAVDFLDGKSAAPVGNSVGHTDGVLSVAVDAVEDGAVWVAVGYRDGWVKIYNTATRKLVRRFVQVHASGVTSLVFAGARSPALAEHHVWVVSGSFDGTIQVLDIREGKSVQRIVDAHQLKYVLSLCVLRGVADGEEVQGIVSAGNNGTLCFWRVVEAGLQQEGPARTLRCIHASLQQAVPARVLALEGTGPAGEFLVLTRGEHVLLLSARFTGEAAQPVAVALHGTIRAPRPLYAACLRVTHTPALAAPLLSVFLTDRDGTILLYNVEMTWRQEQGQAGGGRMELRPTDESSIVVVDHGKAVGDLNVVSVPGPEDSLLAYSPSLSTMYLLSWS